jgi:hypothetical protein
MTAKPNSGSNFWENPGTKAICIGGSGAVGGSQMHHNHQENKHKKIMRGLEMVEKLNNRSITPKQYVKYASQDNVPTDEITEELVGWGEKWKGTDFADPEAFSVTEKWITSENAGRRLMGLRDRSCELNHLKTNQSDKGTESESELSFFDVRLSSVPIAEQKEKGTTPKYLGRRGGSTELMDVQKVTENGLEMSTQCYKDSPNLVYEVSTEEVQAVSDRPVLRSYTFVSPGEISPIFYSIFGVFFVFTSSVVVEYLLRKLSRWTNPKNSQNSVSTMQQNRSVERPSGEEQESATKATPQLLFEIFKSYQSKTISKKKATYILVNFYNLSEIEAIHLLDE